MHWWDFALILVNVIITIASLVGAYKSLAYYKRSKLLTDYANTNVAFLESGKIISTLTEMLKLANVNKQRGRDYAGKVAENGELIRNSISKIRESMSVNDFRDIQTILRAETFNIENYIDSFITGAILVNEKIEIDDNFTTCQQAFCDMQLLIKQKADSLRDKLN